MSDRLMDCPVSVMLNVWDSAGSVNTIARQTANILAIFRSPSSALLKLRRGGRLPPQSRGGDPRALGLRPQLGPLNGRMHSACERTLREAAIRSRHHSFPSHDIGQ